MLRHLDPFPTDDPDPATVVEVEDLVARAAAADGFPALNEAGLLRLRHPRPSVRHLLLRTGPGRLAGYAQLSPDGPFVTGELVVDPDARGRGVGSALLGSMLSRAGSELRIWAVHNTPAAARLAERHRLSPVRELLVMERPLEAPVPPAPLPPGTGIRPFRAGRDEPAWLAVNARAFADHPEQGRLGPADLAERMAEPWFDPDGFLLAVREDRLVGYHWTKRHPDGTGEVYVLGVDPGAGGRGLGRALLAAGLEHLRRTGSPRVRLYVEADHARAVRLYEGYGFTVASRDVMYAPEPPSAARPASGGSGPQEWSQQE